MLNLRILALAAVDDICLLLGLCLHSTLQRAKVLCAGCETHPCTHPNPLPRYRIQKVKEDMVEQAMVIVLEEDP
eukprot:1778112-Amphidinium_carterae.1